MLLKLDPPNIIPGTQMTCVLIGKDIVLKG